MWENNRADGKRKLKANAVPTIFGDEAKNIVSSKNQNTKKSSYKFMEKYYKFIKNYKLIMILNISFQKSYYENGKCISPTERMSCDELSIQNEEENDRENELLLEIAENKKELKGVKDELKNTSRTIRKQKQIVRQQSRIIKNLNEKMRKYKKGLLIVRSNLKDEKKKQNNCLFNAKLLNKLKEIFTDDQIKCLKRVMTVNQWRCTV